MPPAGKKRKKSSSPFVASGLAEVMAAETNQGAPSRSRIVVRCGGLVDIGKQKVRSAPVCEISTLNMLP